MDRIIVSGTPLCDECGKVLRTVEMDLSTGMVILDHGKSSSGCKQSEKQFKLKLVHISVPVLPHDPSAS